MNHTLSFKVRTETIALFRELQAAIRAELGGGEVEDDLILHEIVAAQGGEVMVSRSDTCQLVSIDAAGESFPVDAVVENMFRCDAQEIPHVGEPHPHPNKRARQIAASAQTANPFRFARSLLSNVLLRVFSTTCSATRVPMAANDRRVDHPSPGYEAENRVIALPLSEHVFASDGNDPTIR